MSNSWRGLLVGVVLLAGMLLAFGCDNGDNGDGDDTPEATEPMEDGDGTEEPSDGDDGGEGVEGFLEEYGVTEFKISYNMSGTDTDEGTMTIYWKPDVGWRVDFSSGGDEGSIITTGDASYICTPADGGQCLSSPITSDVVPVPFFNLFTDPNELESMIGGFGGIDFDQSSREIAGVDAECFSGSGEIEGVEGEAEFCFGEGFLLYFSGGDDTGQFTLEATSVETSVDDSDLEPPYEVMEIPGLDDISEAP